VIESEIKDMITVSNRLNNAVITHVEPNLKGVKVYIETEVESEVEVEIESKIGSEVRNKVRSEMIYKVETKGKFGGSNPIKVKVKPPGDWDNTVEMAVAGKIKSSNCRWFIRHSN
jgi:hypothetical protein